MEVNKESVLNHEPTLAKFAQRLPSHESRAKYVELRMKGLEDNKTKLEIMNAFLILERKRQKAIGRLEVRKPPPKAEDRQTPGRGCFGCGQEGHLKYQCPEKAGGAKDGGNNRQPARAHASMKTEPKVCPVCSGQHSFSDKGDLLYRTQLSSCPTSTISDQSTEPSCSSQLRAASCA